MRGLLKLILLGVVPLILAFLIWSIFFIALQKGDIFLARPWTMPDILLSHNLTDTGKLLSVVSGLGALMLWGLFLYAAFSKSDSKDVHGEASFASESQIKKAKLFSKTGLILGRHSGKYLVDNGQTHVFVSAPTGSGKGVGLVIPNLLNWNGSAVILDVKGENHKLTSGFRKAHGQDVFVFSPFSKNSHRFNPFNFINPDKNYRLNDIQNIANIIYPDPEKTDPIWSQQGRSLFVAFALYLLDNPETDCTLGEILRHLQTEQDSRDVAASIVADYREELDPTCLRTLASFSRQEKRLSESIKIGLVGALQIWDTPSVDAATAQSDFDISKLRSKRMSIYVSVSLADIKTLRPLLRLFFETVFSAQLREEPTENEPHKILFLLDEFEALGVMEQIVDRLPFVRSFGVRLMIIIQGLSQLDQRYSSAGREKILQGSKHQIFFASNDLVTTRYVSESLGKQTVRTSSRTVGRGGATRNRRETGRDLMMSQEIRELNESKEIIITEGIKPILANKIRYFKDRTFKKRVHYAPTSIPVLNIERKAGPVFRTQPLSDEEKDIVDDLAAQFSNL